MDEPDTPSCHLSGPGDFLKKQKLFAIYCWKHRFFLFVCLFFVLFCFFFCFVFVLLPSSVNSICLQCLLLSWISLFCFIRSCLSTFWERKKKGEKKKKGFLNKKKNDLKCLYLIILLNSIVSITTIIWSHFFSCLLSTADNIHFIYIPVLVSYLLLNRPIVVRFLLFALFTYRSNRQQKVVCSIFHACIIFSRQSASNSNKRSILWGKCM